MPRPTPIVTRHGIFVLVREGMRQGDIAARVAVAGKPLIATSWGKNCHCWNQGSQQELIEKPLPAKQLTLQNDPQRQLQECPCPHWEDEEFVWGVRVGRKTFNNRLVTRGYYARRILRKPPLTANHRHLRLDWARLPGERFQQDCQAAGVQVGGGSVHLWGEFHRGAKSLLCS